MSIDEFRNALRTLLNDAVRSGLDIDRILAVVDEESHPEFGEFVPQDQGSESCPKTTA